jgi:hypothetical protein
MSPRRFSKLVEKLGIKKVLPSASGEKTATIDPDALAKAEAEAKAALDKEKLEKFLATEVAPKQEIAIQRRKELKADELEEAIAKSQQGREFSGYKNWAEGGPTTEELRRAALERFQQDKAEGARDIDLSKLKATVGIGALAATLNPNESEAAPQIPRKTIEQALNKSKNIFSPGGVDFNQFLRSLRKDADGWVPSEKSQLASQEILNHLILDRTGLPEEKTIEAIRQIYPETKNIPIEGDLLTLAKGFTNPKERYDLEKNTFGAYFGDPLKIGKQNPLKSKISYNPEKVEKTSLAALLGHEAQHLRDDIFFPTATYFPYAKTDFQAYKNLRSLLSNKPKNYDEINKLMAELGIKNDSSPILIRHVKQLVENPYGRTRLVGDNKQLGLLSPEELFSSFSLNHHVSYPKNYELEKAREIVEKGILPIKEADQLKRMIQLDREYSDTASSLDKKAAAIGGAAIGAGMLANSPSAHADEGPTVSQSNPEHSSSSTSNTVRKAAAEEQRKSNLLNALETYGTAARSGVSSAFLGTSEPVVSGLSAAVGSLISAGFDAEDALDFVKKATSPERFKKEYESDVEYRKRMQKEHPIADISGSLAGAFSPVGPAAKIAGLIGKGTAKAGEALYKAGALKKLSGAVGAPAARAITKTGLAAGEGAAFIPAVSFPEQKIKELAGFSEPSEHSVFDELNEPSTLEEAESGAKIQGGVKSGVELAKLLKRLRR